MSFDSLKPDTIPVKSKLTAEDKRRLKLGEAIIPIKGLKASDKADIYKILTGEDYPSKKGRPSEECRNYEVAVDFLYLMGASTDCAKDIMKKLAKIYNLPGVASDLDPSERNISDVNFNKIVVQQLNKVESNLLAYIDAVDYGLIEDSKGIYTHSKTCLAGFARYKANKKLK